MHMGGRRPRTGTRVLDGTVSEHTGAHTLTSMEAPLHGERARRSRACVDSGDANDPHPLCLQSGGMARWRQQVRDRRVDHEKSTSV